LIDDGVALAETCYPRCPNSLTPACKPGVGGNVSNQSELYVILLPYSKWESEREEGRERERERERHTHTHTHTEAENSGVRRKENGRSLTQPE
jgi:hypothetical protein